MLKVSNPETVSDFRPISLLNISQKLLTKILADRLQSVILKLVHKNQNGFIRSRSIQDYLAWSFEYIHQCHHLRRRAIVLKLDFEKAYDKLNWDFLYECLKQRGFGIKWCDWFKLVMSSGTASVKLNNTTGSYFKSGSGVRQGDPLSPLLFVLAADFLQSMINKAEDLGLLNLPIPMEQNQDFPVI